MFRLCRTIACFVLALCTSLLSYANPIYTWVDEHGTRHFSDTPAPNATLVSLAEAEPSKIEASSIQTPPEVTPSNPQNSVSLLVPHQAQTIRNNLGVITVRVQTERPLAQDAHLQLLFDGRRYGAPQTKTQWQLTNIDRGTHTIEVQLFQGGKLIASTPSITVFLHRASIQ
ncbi:DUF4124 domain-containing protein [Vibrio sp. SM6]|uniref:DUF4124 domain-containing protein n=1 Tax=Vibrio agarilyticus TaxID=2726741 RepID=A0A7X8YHF4_9VIBR|nr:DUF4124 domain-containing protein [Vibrio agarilyticus]NLS13674.1 DUF4124 domain-containing protein [Vibrio agarilyticus]